MYIDVHGHLAPLGEQGGGPPSLRDPEAMIELKRSAGIGLTIIGSPAGGAAMLPGPARALQADSVRAHNERMGELVEKFPESLRAYAYLDPFGDERMLSQAFELVRDWQFVGLIVNSSVRDTYLGSPHAETFFAMAAEADVPVLVHPPARPVGAASVDHLGLVEHAVRFCDVTMGLVSVVCGGWLERFPAVRLIAAAGGGGLAFLPEKLDVAMGTGRPSESLRRVFVDTSCPSRAQLIANLSTFGSGNMLFGTDAPPLVSEVERLASLIRQLPISAEERTRIGSGNAAELFGLAPAAACTGPTARAGAGPTAAASA